MQFQEFAMLCGMACADNATTSEKLHKIKSSEYFGSFCLQILLAHPVTKLQFFSCDGNAIISENCTAVTSENCLSSCNLRSLTLPITNVQAFPGHPV